MEYNKRRFQKANDKKVLHKVKKNWVVMSMALLMAIGGEAVATHVSAHADTTNNSNQSNNSTNTIKDRLNQQLIQGQKQVQNNQSQPKNDNQTTSQINTRVISQQASMLHQRIVNNAASFSNNRTNLRTTLQGRNKAEQGQTIPESSVSAANTVPSAAPINQKASFNSAYQDYEARMSGIDAKVASMNSNNINNKALIKNNGNNNIKAVVNKKVGVFQGINYAFYPRIGYLEFLSDNNNSNDNNSILHSDGILIGRYTKDPRGAGQMINVTPEGIKLSDIKSVKIDSDVNINTAWPRLFYGASSLQNVDLSHMHKNNTYITDAIMSTAKQAFEDGGPTGGEILNETFSGVPLKSLKLPNDVGLPYSVSDNSYIIHMDPDVNKRNELIKELNWTGKASLNLSPETNADVIRDNTFINPKELIQHLKDDSDMIVPAGTTQDPEGYTQNLLTNVGYGLQMGFLNLSPDMKSFFSSKYIKPYKPTFYSEDPNNGHIASTATNITDGQSHPGVWMVSPTNSVNFRDIYSDVDGLTGPSSSVTKMGNPTGQYSVSAPQGWALVNSDGKIASGTNDVNNDSKSFNYIYGRSGYIAGTRTVDVAPVYDGMTYKYDKARNSVEFTGGIADTKSNQNDANLNNVNDAFFDNGVDLSNVNNINNILSNDNKLRDLIITSDVKLSNHTLLPEGSWINISANDPYLVKAGGTVYPGVWTRNAEMVDYVLNGQQNMSEGHQIFLGPLDSNVMISKNPVGLKNGYQVTTPGNVLINGSTAYVSVEDATPKTVHTSIKVEYENNHGNTISDDIPITLNGNNNNDVCFVPTNVAMPNGYQLDGSRNKSDYEYHIDSSNNGNGHWQNNDIPTIFFKGNSDNNDSVIVNQIVRSPKGAIIHTNTAKVTINGHVGDHYTITTASKGLTTPPDWQSDTAEDQPVTGEILASSLNKDANANSTYDSKDTYKTYLSQPTVTFNYVDSNPNDANGTLNVHYINQNNEQVGTTTDSQFAGTTVNAGSFGNVPSGYTVNDPNAKYQITTDPQDVNVAVTGNANTVYVEYDYSGQQVAGSTDDKYTKGRIGDTIPLPTNHLPKGYQLVPGDRTTYQLNSANVNNNSIVYHMNVKPTVKVFPINYVDQNNNQVGSTDDSIDGQMGQQINLPFQAPKGYQYANPAQEVHTISQSDLTNNSDRFKSDTIQLNGDKETLPINFVKADGSVVGTTSISDQQIGDTVSLKDLVKAPSDYKINNNQQMQYSFTPDNMSQTPNQMKALTLYVSPTNQHYQLIINAEEMPNHKHKSNHKYKSNKKPTAIKKIPYDVIGSDGQVTIIHPNDARFVPAGYINDPKNAQLKVEITNHGLINVATQKRISDYTWKYDVTNNPNAFEFQYIDSSDDQPVGNKIPISGNVNSHITLTEHYRPPKGYALNSDVQTNYLITSSDNNKYIPLYIHSINGSKIRHYKLTFVIETPNGQVMSHYTKGIPITVGINGQQPININNYFPYSDSVDYRPDFSRSTNQGNVSVKNTHKGLTTNGGTFYYYATDANIKPIIITYIDQNGKVRGHKTIGNLNDYYGEKVNVTDSSDGGLPVPEGYTLNSNQNVNYTFNDNQQNISLYIEGNVVKTTAPVKLMHTSKCYPDQNKYLSDSVPEIVNLPIQGRVGDQFSFNVSDFSGYLPSGYTFASLGNTYHPKADYLTHQYSGQLTPSDVQGWHSDSWIHGKTSSDAYYWYNTPEGESLPLLVLQADDNKKINFDIFDTHNKIIDTITIGKGVAKENHKPIQKLSGFDPAYNDPIDTSASSKYVSLLPKGYYYDSSYNDPANPSQVRFELNPEDVGIHVAGKLESVHVIYKDHNGKQVGSDFTNDHYQYPASNGKVYNDSIRVGDTINLPRYNVPKGYSVDDGDPTKYTVNYSDDPESHTTNQNDLSGIGTITRALTVTPTTETLPIRIVNQNGDQIGSDSISDKIGQTIPLADEVNGQVKNIKSMIPSGYTLNKTDQNAYQNYQFSTNNIDSKDPSLMMPVTLHVTGKPATIQIAFVNDSGQTVDVKTVQSQVGDIIMAPSNSSDAHQYDGLSNNYDMPHKAYNVVVVPSDANSTHRTTINVKGKLTDAHNLCVNVVYEHADGSKTSDNSVPITVTGNYGSMTHFDPANLAKPSGYVIDSDSGKTQTSYNVMMDKDDAGAEWNGIKGNPVIYLKGVDTSKNLTINQIVESPYGVILSDTSTTVPVSDQQVGDTYTVNANDPKIKMPANAQSVAKPNGTLNKPLTGKILENEVNGKTTTYLSQPADTIYYVDSKDKTGITVHYINSDGNVVGNKVMSDQPIGAPLNMDLVNDKSNNVPAGYTYNSSNPSHVYYGRTNKDLYLKVDGQSASVNEEYYDGNHDMHISAGVPTGNVGNTITLSDENFPSGYHLVSGVKSYTFSPDDVNASTRHTEKIQVAPNQMTVPIDFVDGNGNLVGQTTLRGNRDDDTDHLITHLPVGYRLNNDNDSYNFSQNTPNSSDTMPSDYVQVHSYDGTRINLHFQMPGYNYDVESDPVYGQYGTQLDAMNYMPIGYHLDNPNQNTQLIYTFNSKDAKDSSNNPIIEVDPDQANVKSIPVDLVYQDSTGKQLSNDQVNVPIKTDKQGNFTVKPSDKTGYVSMSSDVTGNLVGGLNITSKNKGTFVYKAESEAMPIQFMNQDGNNIGAPATAHGYYGETVNASELKTLGAVTPNGYTLMNPNYSYQFTTDDRATQYVMVKGKSENDVAQINIVENDPYGKQLRTFNVNEPINGQVGDSYNINASDLTPSGYQAAPATKTDSQKLSGQINSDGKLSNDKAQFIYNSTAATSGLYPITLIYIADGETVGKSVINPPAHVYAGEVENIKSSVINNVPKGYSVDNRQDMSSPFSTIPTHLYVQVERAKNNQSYQFTANVIQNFYGADGKLFNVKTIPVTETGGLNQLFHIYPKDYQVPGYTMKNGKSDVGMITTYGLVPSTVTYNYVANSSTDKNSGVQPVNVTFRDASDNQTVGVPQRVDGAMDETVNVFSRTTIPSDYHLVADQNPFVTFGTQPQSLTYKVATNQSKIGKVTIMYYDVEDPNSLVDQVTAEDPVGMRFDLKPYETNVPQNYQFNSMDNNKYVSQTNGSDPTIQVINGTRYVTMRVNKIVTNSIVYEDINNDKHPVSVQLRSGLRNSPMKQAYGAVPQGFHIVKLSSARPVFNGGKDIVWIQRDAPANSSITIKYVKYDVNGKYLDSDQTTVYGHDGDSFDLTKYEQQMPSGFTFASAKSNGSMDYFTKANHTITINTQQTVHHSHYGKVVVKFVKASDPSQKVGLPLVSMGYEGNVFDVTPFEHNAPEGYDYAGVLGQIPHSYDPNNVQELVIKVK